VQVVLIETLSSFFIIPIIALLSRPNIWAAPTTPVIGTGLAVFIARTKVSGFQASSFIAAHHRYQEL